jgi:hypothetical protein
MTLRYQNCGRGYLRDILDQPQALEAMLDGLNHCSGLGDIPARLAAGEFHLPATPDSVRPILEILPLEMMTLAFAELKGREAGTFSLASKVTSVE